MKCIGASFRSADRAEGGSVARARNQVDIAAAQADVVQFGVGKLREGGLCDTCVVPCGKQAHKVRIGAGESIALVCEGPGRVKSSHLLFLSI